MIKLLDRGYVKFIEPWGTGLDGKGGAEVRGGEMCIDRPDYEVGIVEAARQSTQGSFRGWEGANCTCGDFKEPSPSKHKEGCAFRENPGDKRLLSFLYNKKHSTPFEFAGLVLEIQAPIMVFREWHRHRTQSYSEMSARYSPLPEGEYRPTMERVMMVNQKDSNKQAGNVGGIELTAENAMEWFRLLDIAYATSAEAYRFGLAVGVAKELARCPMPVGQYTRMRAAANLRNWLAFLTLRMDPDAQWEIRQFANAVGVYIKQTFPQTWKLYVGD